MDSNEAMNELSAGNEAAFEQLYKLYFRELHAYAFSLVRDWDIAEEIVQSMFLRIWEKEGNVQVTTSVRSYLYRSVYNRSLNHIRNQKVQLKYQTNTAHAMKDQAGNATEKLATKELELNLQKALNKLPEKCRAIFHLSRFEELKYKEIADKFNISIKTVEAQMGKALRILRQEMIEFLPIIAIMLLNIFRP
jgi:RNA polymerase sigma-70 factor, ECF subfamily